MQKKHIRNEDISLPPGWQMCQDFDGKVFFIDHNRQETSWIDPRDRITKPNDFSECSGDELPYGWEQARDQQIGIFYTNHISKKNQVEDPRQVHLRAQQERMLSDYLVHAQQHVQNKKNICRVKEERLAIAREEVHHLNNTLKNAKGSAHSLQSVASTGSKYDPELLRGEVDLAKKRVTRLRHEIRDLQQQMQCKERGLETLSQVEQKLVHPGDNIEGSVYSREDAQGIIAQIRNNHHSLAKAENEKRRLLSELAGLREEVYGHRLGADNSPHLSTSSLARECLSTSSAASQTDLSGEASNKWGEVARMRLQYNEATQQLSTLQKQLADVEEQISPAQNECDKDRLILISEKEQLLRELRSVQGRPKEEMNSVQARIQQLQHDLQAAVQQSNRQITERIKLNDNKSDILRKLEQTTRLTTYLEAQIRSMSLSTLSISSGSSRGSLGSLASSKGSLSSLNFTDIYTQPTLPDVDLPDLHRRVEKLLQGVKAEEGGSNQYLATIEESPQYHHSAVSPHGSHSSLGSGRVGGYGSGNHLAETGQMGGSMVNQGYGGYAHEANTTDVVLPPPSYQQHIDHQHRTNSNSQPNVHTASNTVNTPQQQHHISSSHPNLALAPIQMQMNANALAMTEEYANVAGAALQQDFASSRGQHNQAMPSSGMGPPQTHHGSHGALSRIPVEQLYARQSSLQQLAEDVIQGKLTSDQILANNQNAMRLSQTNLAAGADISNVNSTSLVPGPPPPPPPYPGNLNQAIAPGIPHPGLSAANQLAPNTAPLPQSASNPNLSASNPTNDTGLSLPAPVLNRDRKAPMLSIFNENSSVKAGARPKSASSSIVSGGGRSRMVSESSSHSGGAASASGSHHSGVGIRLGSESSSRSGAGARSISAAVSNESVAGDSGVFEATNKRSSELDKLIPSLESAQVQIKLRYDSAEGCLYVTIEQARNLSALQLPQNSSVCIKAALLPSSQCGALQTSSSENLNNPQFKETFRVPVAEHKLGSQTLQVHVCTLSQHVPAHELLGSLQVSLAAFASAKGPVTAWYNVLSLRFMHEPAVRDQPPLVDEKPTETASSVKPALERAFYKPTSPLMSGSNHGSTAATASREESSDESTIISSQTSTLTRGVGPEAMGQESGALQSGSSEEEEEFDEIIDVDSDDNFSPEGTVRFVSVDKQTNTDASSPFSMQHLARKHVTRQRSAHARGAIRRSQTFTPHVFKQNDDSLKNTQLNRSDSDSSVRRKDPFQRNAAERKSVRHRRSMIGLAKSSGGSTLSLTPAEKLNRTSIDLELDLQASQALLTQLDEDVQRLKLLKNKFEAAKHDGSAEPPKWLTENEPLQIFLAQADSLKHGGKGPGESGGHKSSSEKRVEYLLCKNRREAQKHSQQNLQFRDKILKITSLTTQVPLPIDDSDSEEDMTSQGQAGVQGHSRKKPQCKASRPKTQAAQKETLEKSDLPNSGKKGNVDASEKKSGEEKT